MMSAFGKLFHILLVITPIWSFEDDPILLAPTLTVKKTLEFDGVEERNSSEVYTTGDMVRDEEREASRPPRMVTLADELTAASGMQFNRQSGDIPEPVSSHV